MYKKWLSMFAAVLLTVALTAGCASNGTIPWGQYWTKLQVLTRSWW
jgi:outer membrane murein-binding lipoprotein Lpp